MNFAMWKKALNVIPEVSKEEWDQLDVISKWLISTRAAVLIMTFISAAIAGIFAFSNGQFSLGIGPADFPPEAWPTYFAAAAFMHNRRYGLLFILGLLVDAVIRVVG